MNIAPEDRGRPSPSAPLLSTTACAAAGAEDGVVPVAVGYQSKTINTVTAGTLMKELGLLEKHLDAAAEETGETYDLTWHDFASGPPLTAEMIAGKVQIGSMGDFPLSVNGAKTAEFDDVKTSWVSVTGYNLSGSLNQVVVPTRPARRRLADLGGEVVSTSLGSTAHGNLVSALDAAGMSPDDVELLGQDPPVGVTALESDQVDALAQFVPFPQRVIFSGEGRLLHDGNTGVPTFHGVVAANAYTEAHPEVLQAFLAAQQEAHGVPLRASAGGRDDGRRGHRAAAGGGLPLQRPERSGHLRHDHQGRTRRRGRDRPAVPAGPRRPRSSSTSTSSSTRSRCASSTARPTTRPRPR